MAKAKKKRRSGTRPQGAKRPTDSARPKADSARPKADSARPKADSARPKADKPTRAERLEAARRARRRKTIAVRLAVGAVVALLVAGVVIRVVGDRNKEQAGRQKLTAGSCTLDPRADPTDPSPRNHVPDPTYRVNPPAGGNHSPQAADARVYQEGNVPPDGEIVHAMEHGYVVLWHRPNPSDAERQAVQRAADRYERDVLVVPRDSLPTPVAATAWGRRLLCKQAEAEALTEFVGLYRNKGPEKVPHT